MALHLTGPQLVQCQKSAHALLGPTAVYGTSFKTQNRKSTFTSLRKSGQSKEDMRYRNRGLCVAEVFKVELEHEGGVILLDVPEDETILDVALESGLELSYDCKLGVCMTCPAKLETGQVDQSGGMLSDDVAEKGYTLLCVSYPRSDCKVRVIPEEELLSLQLATAND